MRGAAAVFLLLPAALAGQSIVEERQVREELRDFTPRPGEQRLECEIRIIKPVLDFSFRYRTGYVLSMPMRQYSGKGHSWGILIRVTPEEGMGQPVYLVAGQRLPEIPKNKATLQWAGAFLVGEGRYNVDWVLGDSSGRVCRKSWRIEAKPKRSERSIVPAIAPGTVDDISLRRTGRKLAVKNGAPHRRITILLHATPANPNRLRMRSYDRVLLLNSLSTLLERLPAAQVRVVAFSLEQQKELFRSDNFNREGFRTLSRTLDDLELGLVDYDVLKNRKGHVDLLADLISEELAASTPADAVVILGPAARQFDKVPKSMLEEKEASRPRFFYFQHKPNWVRGAEFPDTITYAMKRIGGKIAVIRSPADFGKAINQLADAVSGAD